MKIVVTGATGGIGRAIADALETDGHQVHRHTHHLCNVADPMAVNYWATGIKNQYQTIDGMIHCAGIAGEVSSFAESDTAKWTETIHVNLVGAYLSARALVPLMGKGGFVIFMSGGGAFNAFPNMSAYAASKAGIVRMMETLADELAPKIMVNCIAPGFQKTRLVERILEAGPKKGGKAYAEALKNMDAGGDLAGMIECVRFMIGKGAEGITGRTISASFDKWGERGFVKKAMAGRNYQMGRFLP